MLIKRFFTPGLAINSFLVFDEEKKLAVAIDPTRQVELYLEFALDEGIEIAAIFETHVHADFISGAKELKAALDGKPTIYCSGMGEKQWSPAYADLLIQKNRQAVVIGNMRFEAWHTPGHTPEHIIWIAFDRKRSAEIPECAFTGDLLFVGSVGRPDLLGHKAEEQLLLQLYQSLFETLKSLPDSLEIFPSHGSGSLCGKNISKRDSSTLGYERRYNPWLIPQFFAKWKEDVLGDLPASPAYFTRMKRLNISSGDFNIYPTMPAQLSLEQIKDQPECIIVDMRKPEQFAIKHLKGSINIPWAPAFSLWAAITLKENQPIILVIDTLINALSAVQALKLTALDHVRGVCLAAEWNEGDSHLLFDRLPLIDVQTLNKHEKEFYILDVRTPWEWQSGHITSAHHIELTSIPEKLSNVPKNQPIAVICHSGNRASIVASLLVNKGWHAYNVQGGMQAWEKAHMPQKF